MSETLQDSTTHLRKFLNEKEEMLQSKGTLLDEWNSFHLFSKQIDELENAAKEIEINFADNENILFNFNKRVSEIRNEIENFDL